MESGAAFWSLIDERDSSSIFDLPSVFRGGPLPAFALRRSALGRAATAGGMTGEGVQSFLCGLQRTPVGGAVRDAAEFTAGVGAGLATVGFYLVVTGQAAAVGGALTGSVPVALGGVIVTGFGLNVTLVGGGIGLGGAVVLAGLGDFRTGAKATLDVLGRAISEKLAGFSGTWRYFRAGRG